MASAAPQSAAASRSWTLKHPFASVHFCFTVAELSTLVGSNVALAALALSEIVVPWHRMNSSWRSEVYAGGGNFRLQRRIILRACSKDHIFDLEYLE
jgi:hypothetical protein